MIERRKQQIKLEGKDAERLESCAKNIIESMCEAGLDLSEANIVLNEAGCILQKIEKYSPNTPLRTIRNLHLNRN